MTSNLEVTWTPEVDGESGSSGHSLLTQFAFEYGRYHGYISVVVCVLGIICSLLVIAVLTRRHMITSSNYMLTALAICDLITMLSYIPYAIQFYCLYGVARSLQRNTLASARFCIVHANLSVTAHTASIWITVALSAFRYSMVRRAADGRAATTASAGNDLRTSRWIVLLVCASSTVVLIPNYLTLAVAGVRDPMTNETMYDIVTTSSQPNSTVVDMALNTTNFWIHACLICFSRAQMFPHLCLSLTYLVAFSQMLSTHFFWIHALIIKLIPCVLMSVFGFLLVVTVRRQRQRSQMLLRNRKNSLLTKPKCHSKSKGREGTHTTAMLVSVIVLFLITEFPQGVLALISGLEPTYFTTLYQPLGDVMDIAALVNNAINFVLYCAMSRQFRQTFVDLFARKPTRGSSSV